MTETVVVVALLLVAASATAAVAVRDPVRQSLVLAVLGVVLAVLFTVLQAPDVGLSQLAVELGRVPDTMTAVPALLLAGAFAAGAVPGFGDAVAHAMSEATTAGLLHTSVRWTPLGVGPGVLSSVLAVALAAVAVARPGLLVAPNRALPLRRLQSGHIGDYVAWLLVGATVLGVPALPAVVSG
ncbi:hydrogenase subunit MbhD domain-containing protein [Streptomyces sp. NPDC058783]|uniref:hydrogenase subunit MbhD domain-containing protein n=1 Tax=unclassified Streptomyces TaxID=2593676 RepID=UPI0036647080